MENRFKIDRVVIFWRECGKQTRKSEERSMKKGNLVKAFNSQKSIVSADRDKSETGENTAD